MHHFFSITIEDIRDLTDEQSREFIARLCRAELGKHGFSQAAVSWGGDQRAIDGGVDVRVDVDPPMGMSGYIKKDRSAFQVKAEKFSKGKIPNEMAPKGVIRPAIVELAENNGAYVIVSTRDSVSASSLSTRIKAMAACLSEHGLSEKVIVDFYDCRKIADWIEQHPAIAVWTRYIIGKPLAGWHPYSPWAYQESNTEAEYIIDDRVKIFVPNADEGIDVQSAINQLRRDLSNNVSVRIVGLSGVGKTRLVQALFDKRIRTEAPALDIEKVLYTDLSNNPTPQPNAMIEALMSDNSDCVVVVDNCGQDVHQKLTEIIKTPGSKIRLLTVEYDIRDDIPEGTICYRLEGSSDDVIKKLLRRRFDFLSDSDLDKIADFSDGNARVAYALAASTETTGELAQLRDAELFKRLFFQKHAEDDTLLQCAEAASLLYSFDGEDITSSSEIAILASIADVSVVTFLKRVAELHRRGLVQQRGKWRAVLPHAISNRLAMRAIEAVPKNFLVNKLVMYASDRVALSFSRRLGYLHESKAVREIVLEWLEPGGRFSELASLNEIGRQIFTNIAPVHQNAALNSLERASLNLDFVSKKNRNRSHFSRVARALAYEPLLFDQAINVLIRFALAEPENHNNDSTREILKSLFSCHLSGTEAQSAQRAKIVHELILSTDEERQKIGFSLLKAAMEALHFSSSYGFDFGARKRGYGWWPRTSSDTLAWYKPFLDIAVEVGKCRTARGRQARAILGESVSGLWVGAGLSKEISAASKELLVIDGWPEGWLGLRNISRWHKDKISEESLQELRTLETILAPLDLKAKIRAKVLANGSFANGLDWDGEDLENPISRYRRAEVEAEDLGKAAACENELLSELLPDLLEHNTNSNLYKFGFGVGLEAHDAAKLVAGARHLASAKPDSVNLTFLRGFISSWNKLKPEEVSAFLDGALCDEVWARRFPELQLQVDLYEVGYKRILKSLELNNTPIWQYRYLGFGRVTDSLTVNQISTLIREIASKPDEGLSVAIEVLAMVIHCAREKESLDYHCELTDACISFLQSLDWSIINHDHHSIYRLETILEFALTSSRVENGILDILHHLMTYIRSDRLSYINMAGKTGKLLAQFFKIYPIQTLDVVYIADEDGSYRTALKSVSLVDSNRQESAICEVPVETLIEWCKISPGDRYLFAAQTCRLFKKEPDKSEDTIDLVWSDAAIRVLADSTEKRAILHIFIDRFRPSSFWAGSLSAILRNKLPLLARLNPTGDESLGREIVQAEDEFRKQIVGEEAREEAREREQTGTFE